MLFIVCAVRVLCAHATQKACKGTAFFVRTQHKKRAKVLLFSELTKFFFTFLQKKNFIRRFRNH